MDPRLAGLIRDFQRRVGEAVEKLRAAGVPRPDSNTDWARSSIPYRGTIASGEQYRKHGYGCAFRFADGAVVDFDFGDEGQIDGVDAHRLWEFAEHQPARYGFLSRDELLATFDREVSSGTLRFSGYILYYVRD